MLGISTQFREFGHTVVNLWAYSVFLQSDWVALIVGLTWNTQHVTWIVGGRSYGLHLHIYIYTCI